MEAATVLLIEDQEADRRLLTTALEKDGYNVLQASSGEAGLELLQQKQPDLVLLDLMLPGVDGLEVCRQIRARTNIPVIMVTGRDEEIDKVVGLELGADDYVTKPYGLRELVARVRAMLRRSMATDRAAAQKRKLVFPQLEIDLPTRTVVCQGESVRLTPKEFDLLYHLASQPRRVFRRDEIVQDVWGYSPQSGDLRTVDTHIKRLRKKLEEGRDVPWSLATVWGVGYKFDVAE
ncbi:MAG: response regulator transcription factor [Armatimonadetes bacterium]|nr:response regulator transcription factor [Armatimonadota bacterium]